MAIDDIVLNMNNVKSKLQQPQGPVMPNAPAGLGKGMPVSEFPIHLYPPRGSSTFDIRRSVNLSAPDKVVTLVDFTVPAGAIAIWNGYSLFSDCPLGVTAEWILTVDDTPIFPYHGDSMNGYKKTLALSTDLSNLIYALKELRGGQRVKVIGTVDDITSPATIAARIVGWIIQERMEIKGSAG